jgi:hypothetical protein
MDTRCSMLLVVSHFISSIYPVQTKYLDLLCSIQNVLEYILEAIEPCFTRNFLLYIGSIYINLVAYAMYILVHPPYQFFVWGHLCPGRLRFFYVLVDSKDATFSKKSRVYKNRSCTFHELKLQISTEWELVKLLSTVVSMKIIFRNSLCLYIYYDTHIWSGYPRVPYPHGKVWTHFYINLYYPYFIR